ncbi:hypothetical protein LCGC14_1279670 [marine sediment metagenome]|uniref:Uncharacterized protein n=1 Tax=marine sediment metagenome TaxID=412755 RepID=A0A0F9LGW3_9ZZZZ
MRNSPLRELARSVYWQNLYARAKELNLQLFENTSDFSKLQLRFLQWLEIYHSIYVDIASDEELMSYKRIEDDMLVDAYLVYKNKEKENKDKKKDKKFKGKERVNNLPSVIFRSKGKK